MLTALTAPTATITLLLGAAAGQPSPDASTAPETPQINVEKITESPPPPLPEQVVLPMPPTFRIAQRAEEVPISRDHWDRAQRMIEAGADRLLALQEERGGWLTSASAAPSDDPDALSPVGAAITALVVKALVQTDAYTADTPAVARAIDVLLAARRPDGSFDNGALANYVNSTIVSALAATGKTEYRVAAYRTAQLLTAAQWDDGEGLRTEQDWFGGAGYGKHGRPDLSNTQTMLDALYDAGLSPDEPAMQRALAFVSRAQNYRATNKTAWAGDDGGFVYTPANGGESMASQYVGEGRYGEKLPEGAARSLRSYGSMTYAGFKSMLYAGLSADDERVRAAFDWIRRHWTFDENPGVGQQGLYYYYHTMARALAVGQQNVVTDIDGAAHNWREEMIDAIAARQGEDGGWVNGEDRWMESQEALCTAYVVLALEEIMKPVTARGVDVAEPDRAASGEGDRR